MRNFIYTHDSKPTRNGWSYQAVKVWEIKKNQLHFIGEYHYTFKDGMQAVCDYLSQEIKAFRKFPKNFVVPAHAELNKERIQLHYSNGFTQNYVDYMVKEARYTDNKKISVQGVSLPTF